MYALLNIISQNVGQSMIVPEILSSLFYKIYCLYNYHIIDQKPLHQLSCTFISLFCEDKEKIPNFHAQFGYINQINVIVLIFGSYIIIVIKLLPFPYCVSTELVSYLYFITNTLCFGSKEFFPTMVIYFILEMIHIDMYFHIFC